MAATIEEIAAGTVKIDWETASPIILQGVLRALEPGPIPPAI
jgi:hypothetical protein